MRLAETMTFSTMRKSIGAAMKTCKSCNTEKPLDFFSTKKKKSGAFTYQTSCKVCRADAARKARKENPELVRSIDRKIRSGRTDEQKARQALYLAEWRKANPQKAALYRPKEILRRYSRTYYEKHKEEIKAAVAEYRRQNPDKIRALEHSRRGREKSGRLSQNIVETLFKKQKGLCVCCHAKLGDDFHLDHIFPLALGGTNTDDNVQLLKSKCNLQKNAKHPIDFMRERGYLL